MRLAISLSMDYILPEVKTEKKQQSVRQSTAPSKLPTQIVLRPCKNDYLTFARRTAISLGLDPEKEMTRKPDAYLLSLMNLGS